MTANALPRQRLAEFVGSDRALRPPKHAPSHKHSPSTTE
jgi:hypothetical protein